MGRLIPLAGAGISPAGSIRLGLTHREVQIQITKHRRYGPLDAAIREAIARGVPHPNAVRLALDHRRELRNEAPPVAVILPDHVKARDAHVQPHRLEPYDQLKEQADE